MLSIITPLCKTHNAFIRETYVSLQQQTVIDWEWIIGVNNGGVCPVDIALDKRVHVVSLIDDDPDKIHNRIGRLKYECALKAHGDYILELDADDLLMPTAVEKAIKAFEDPRVMLVYSNSAQFEDQTWKSEAFSSYWGWVSRDFNYKGHVLKEMIAWEPSPQMMRMIYWAPNHIRAWRKTAYFLVGGHNPEIKTGDDQDLNCRFYIRYGAEGLKHIDECLYLYRTHSENHCVTNNAEVQMSSTNSYNKYIVPMVMRWCKDNELRMLDLGGRMNAWEGHETVDLFGANITTDLNRRWPFEDSSVGEVHAAHIFEHLRDPIHTMNELYRILAPGGFAFIEVPSTDGRGAFQDPSHTSFWNENSFWYYTSKSHANFIPEYKGRFQVSRVQTIYPTKWYEENHIPVVQAELITLKSPYDQRPVGEVLI